jgi:hypothetical protein
MSDKKILIDYWHYQELVSQRMPTTILEEKIVQLEKQVKSLERQLETERHFRDQDQRTHLSFERFKSEEIEKLKNRKWYELLFKKRR